jgi:multisubunit Na+/H+ antiporter MnhF subunit
VIPSVVLVVAFAWAALLLVAGGLLLLRARDSQHRLLALDVLGTIVIIMLATLSYLNGVSYYIDAGLAVALLSFSATIVTPGYIMRRRADRRD